MISLHRWAARGAVALACCLHLAAGAADDPPAGWTPELMLQIKTVADVAVSPDGKRVAYVVGTAKTEDDSSEWLSQIVLAGADGNRTVQLTRGDKSCTDPAWSPDGQWIAFLSARGGSRTNLWRLKADGGEAEQLTDEKGNISAFQWSPDGTQIAFVMQDARSEAEERAEREKRDAFVVDENQKYSRLYVVAVAAGENGVRPVQRLTGGDLHVGGLLGGRNFDWSPDSTRIVFTHQPSPDPDDWPSTDLSIVEIATARVTPLVATPAAETQPMFSPDGRTIAYAASDVPPRWAFASRVHLVSADGEPLRALAETFDQKPSLLGWSHDGQGVLVGETQRTVHRVSVVPIDGSPAVDFSPPDSMVSQPALNAARTHLGFVSEAPDRPPEAFVTRLSAFEPRQVSRAQQLPSLPMGRTEVVSWRSKDDREIEGLLTYPVDHRPGRRAPLLVIIHGGPTGVFTRGCVVSRSPYPIPVFSAKGFAVLRCNVRGSSGYGREFRYANYGDWGGGDYADVMSGVDAMIEKGIAEPERLGVMGWSYGGYLTSWIITQTKRFKAASVGAGVTNLVSFTGTADISDFAPDYIGGEYWHDFDLWRKRSAMFHIGGVTTPTLIQHGDKDLRVPISQSYELYNALRRQGVPVRMVVYPRQPHSIQEPRLLQDAMQRNVDWFDQWLAKEETP